MRCWLFVVMLILCVTIEVRAASSDVAEMGADQIFTILSLRDHLAEIDSWRCNLFKESAWTDLSKLIATYLGTAKTAVEYDQRLKVLKEAKSFAEVIQAVDDAKIDLSGLGLDETNKSVERLKELRELAEKAKQGQPIDNELDAYLKKHAIPSTNPSGAEMAIPVDAELIEFDYLFNAIAPILFSHPTDWRKGSVEDVDAAVKHDVLASIRELADVRREMGIIELLLAQPPADSRWLFDYLELTPEDLGVADGWIKSGQLVTGEARQRLHEFCERVRKATNNPELGKAEEFFKILYSKSKNPIDIPIIGSEMLLRLRAEPTENVRRDGGAVDVTVSASLIRPSKSVVSATQPSSTQPVTPLVDEIPLGIQISDVLLGWSAGKASLKVVGNPLKLRVSTDSAVLTEAMHALGLPECMEVVNPQLTVKAIDDVVIAMRVRGPPFEGLLSILQTDEVTLPPVEISRAGIRVDWSTLLGALGAKFESALNEQLKSERKLSKFVTLMGIKPSPANNWAAGRVEYTARLRIESLGDWADENLATGKPEFDVPVRLVRLDSGKWDFRIRAHEVSNEVIDQLRSRLAAYVIKQLKEAGDWPQLDTQVADRLQRYFHIDDLAWDDTGDFVLTGKVSFGYSFTMNGKEHDVSASCKFKLIPLEGKLVFFDPESNLHTLVEQLKHDLKDIINDVLAQLNVQIAESVEDSINKLDAFNFFGMKMKLHADREKNNRVRIRAESVDLADPIVVDGIYLTAPQLTAKSITSPQSLHAPDFDFTEVELVKPKVQFEKLIERLAGIDPSFVRVTQVVRTKRGVCADVAIHVDALSTDVPIGKVTLGLDSTSFTPADIRRSIIGALVDNLNGKTFDIGDIGPVHNLRVSVDANGNPSKCFGIQALLDGDVALTFMGVQFDMPIQAQVFPDFGHVTVKADGLRQALGAVCGKMFDIDVSGVRFHDFNTLNSSPYGVEFGVTAKFFDTVEVTANNIKITTGGVSVSPCFAGQLPGVYPLGPTGLVLVHPGFELRLRSSDGKPPSLYFTGDITLAYEGVDKVIKMHGKAGATFPPKIITTQGTVVLGGFLPIYRDEGTFKPTKGEILLDSKVIGWLAKLIDAHGKTTVRAREALMSQNASVRFLSLDLADTTLQIHGTGHEKGISATGMAQIPITKAKFTFAASPRMSGMNATAGVKFGVSGFSGLSGDVKVTPGSARLNTGLLGFSLILYTPGVTSLTPANVLRAIENAFDFDISSLWNALKHRRVVVSLIPSKKGKNGEPDTRPPGEGDVPPSEAEPSSAQTSDEGQPSQPEAQKDQESQKQPPAGEQPPSRGAPLPVSSQPEKKDGNNDKLLSDAMTYRPGNATVHFDAKGSRIKDQFVATVTFTSGGAMEWLFEVSQETVDHLTGKRDGKTMMFFTSRDELPADKPASAVCRNGHMHSDLPRILTLNVKGQTFVCDAFPNGHCVPIELDWAKVGPAGLPSGGPDLLTKLSEPQNHLKDGDLVLLRHLMVAKVLGRELPHFVRTTLQSVPLGEGISLPLPEGYLFESRSRSSIAGDASPTDSVYYHFVSREDGDSIEIPSYSKLYEDAGFATPDNPLAKLTASVLSAVHCAHGQIAYLCGRTGGPLLFNCDVQNRQLLLVVPRLGGAVKSLERLNWPDAAIRGDELRPSWSDDQSKLPAALLTAVESETWHSVYFNSDNEVRRLALVRGLDGPAEGWGLRLLLEREQQIPGEAPFVAFPKSAISGKAIEDAFRNWDSSDPKTRQLRKGKAPPDAVGTREWRIWIIAQAAARESEWPNLWLNDPRLLLSQLKEQP